MKRINLLMALACFTACSEPYDYTEILRAKPKSILVLPPINNSVEIVASDDCLSTITQPLAESGYYVFPVAVVNAMMKENGLPGPNEMHAVPLEKLDEIFGADAVLFMTVNKWGQTFQILSTNTTVSMSFKLLDVKTGYTLWQGSGVVSSSNNSGGSPLTQVIAAVATQIISSAGEVDTSSPLARQLNTNVLSDKKEGIMLGPRHPQYAEDILEKQRLLEQLKTSREN